MFSPILNNTMDNTKNSKLIDLNKIHDISESAQFILSYKANKINLLTSFNWKIYFKLFFTSFIKKGLKKRLLVLFNKLLNIIKINTLFSVKIYLSQVFFNLKPVMISKSIFQSKFVSIPLPWHYFSRFWKQKYTTLAVSWIKRSISERSEKTLILRIYSEFENIRLNKGRTIEKKRDFYFMLKKTKAYSHFYKYMKEKC